jgi:hypothetical protein
VNTRKGDCGKVLIFPTGTAAGFEFAITFTVAGCEEFGPIENGVGLN